jgi:hypothetical protein
VREKEREGIYTEGAESTEGTEKRGKNEERFLSAQADTFAGANVKEKASACSVRNDGDGGRCVERFRGG